MLLTVVTSSKSSRIGGGLTYEAEGNVPLGSAVRVPLRQSFIEGIVVEVLERREQTPYGLRPIKEILGSAPVLTDAQLKTVRWMSEYYCCSPRQALGVWLPPPPWFKLLLDDAPTSSVTASSPLVTLDEQQQRGLDDILKAETPALLLGESRDRTEVYAALASKTIRDGKQVIVLVPEIVMTDGIIDRFLQLFPRERIAMMHSDMTIATRRKEWRRIRGGGVDVVIGSRSALFAPLRNLGLVIMDEEQERSYKSEQTPRFHVRETAEELCRQSNARLVMGSLAPSMEAWSRARCNRYGLIRIAREYQIAPQIVDLAAHHAGGLYPFSTPLLQAIKDRLDRKEQSVLLLNKKGKHSAVLCLDCRERVPSDPERGAQPDVCPKCGSLNLKEIGAGTQRAEQILRKQFPGARILRADADALAAGETMQDVLEKMRRGEIDILLGTNTVLKALSLPHVTLAAALVADVGLSLPDYRAGERVFQMLTRLAADGGRQARQVMIQTFRLEAPEVVAAAKRDPALFLDPELAMRVRSGYPPASVMIRLIVRGAEAQEQAKALRLQCMNLALKTGNPISATASAMLPLARGRWQVLLRGEKPEMIVRQLPLRNVGVDVDPIETT